MIRCLAALLALLLGLAPALTARDGRLTVILSDPRDRAQLTAVFAVWRGAGRDLRALGLTLPQVRLEAASSAADFARRTGEAWFVAATTRGQVIHTQRLGALAVRGTLPLTLRHEAFHAAQPPGLPRWLAEGLARIFSGEAAGDPPGRTGLEGVPDEVLEARLAARTGEHLPAAYREATRRARSRLAERGWAGVLNTLPWTGCRRAGTPPATRPELGRNGRRVRGKTAFSSLIPFREEKAEYFRTVARRRHDLGRRLRRGQAGPQAQERPGHGVPGPPGWW